MKKLTSIICVAFVFIMLLSLPAVASAPYQTYTYSITGTALHSPDAYVPYESIDATYMNLNSDETFQKYYSGVTDATQVASKKTLASASDIFVDDEMNVYIADTGNNRIVVLDRYYKLKFIIESFINENGVADALSGPKGVFVTSDKNLGTSEERHGRIFVCDTNKNRIITFDRNGKYLATIAEPESELFEEGSVYKPSALAVDQYDRLYVVSPTTNQGIIVMTDKGEFTGFIGAQKVIISAWDRIWRRFQTDEQRQMSINIIPTQFNNIELYDDFIYVTTSSIKEEQVVSAITGKSKSGDYAPVKLLNAAGSEIMRRNGFYPPSGEVDMKKQNVSDLIEGSSTVVDAASGPEKTWSIIDQKRSKVFTYDFDGNLLFAFGDQGRQVGNITTNGLVGIVYQGDKMLLLDGITGTFTVYERTEYGNILIQALRNQNERRYDQAIDDWTEILKRNSNFDTAYIGIGNALYRNGQYEEAIEYYKSAYDTENYSTAYKEIRKEWLSKFILLIPVAVIVLVVVCSKFLKYAAKVNKRVAVTAGKRTYGQELLYVFHVIFHPFDGFWDLKHEKRGSVRAGATFLALTVLAFYYQSVGQGYVVNPQENYGTILSVTISVVVPVFLWIIANWCLTTLFDGEGSFKDIFIATTYALLPAVIILIPVTIASNFVLATEANILNVVSAVAFIWAGLLIFFGTMVTHDYSMGKNVLTILGTVLAMVCIMFIALLFSTLFGKLVSFVTNIVTEIQFRV